MAEYDEENLIQFDAPPRFRDIKLPSFWSDKPASCSPWSRAASAPTVSPVKGKGQFDQLVGALSKESIGCHAGALPPWPGDQRVLHPPVPVPAAFRAAHHAG